MKFTRLDKDRMNAVFMIVNDFRRKRNTRYDILVDGINQYCLVLNNLKNDKQDVIISYRSGERFINDLLILKKKLTLTKTMESCD